MSPDETRAYLQARMATLFAVMFWSLASLLAFMWVLYNFYDEIAPPQRDLVYAGSLVGLATMAFIWRGLLARRPLSIAALYRIDLVYSIGIGAAFGASAYLQRDLRTSGYLALVYSTFTVFARALIVPSSGARTAITSTLTYVPMTTAAFIIAVTTSVELPGPAFFLGFLVLSAVPVVLSTAGSDIIYGLRRQVDAAQQLGQYTIASKIGEGGMGAVYLAHHILLRRPTAVKLLLPDRIGAENLARFEREVHHMSQLTHPNTVAVYDYGRSPDGVFYYAMEYLGGGTTLEDLVDSHGPQPTARIAHILAQVCGALAEAHANQIIHRDIKPANIILCERGGVADVAKVVDYGLVKEVSRDRSESTGVTFGTPGYLAPETVTDPSSVGPAVDIYALGAVGYFLMTGQRMFDGKTAVEICIKHVTLDPPRPSDVVPTYVSPELEAVIMKCVARRPEDRFASIVELGQALRALPPSTEWTETEAERWWETYRANTDERAAQSAAATQTSRVPRSVELEVRA